MYAKAALAFTFIAFLSYPLIFQPRISFAQSSSTGTIRVCQVIVNPDGSVTTGAEQPNQQFRFQWFSPSRSSLSSRYELASQVPPEALFTTPLKLNTLLPNIPAGPGGLNAQCKDDYNPIILNYQDENNNPFANLFYRELPDPAGEWQPIKYNDGYSGSQTLSTLAEYDGKLFDGNSNNDDDEDRNLNADGHVLLRKGAKRTILIYSRYRYFITPKPTASPTVKPTPTRSPTPKPSATPTRTPSPTPTPAAPTCQTTNSCSDLVAGRKTSFDTIVAPTAANPITVNDSNVWIKITINQLNNQTQTIRLNEFINSTNFTFDNPAVNIMVKKSGTNITNNCTNGASGCSITTATGDVVVINFPPLAPSERYEVFLKILPQREGSNLQVNSPSSRIRYQNGTEVSLDNATLTVNAAPAPATAYFTTQNSGNIYSGGTITNPLPGGASLFETIAGILLRRTTGPINLGSGTISNPPEPTYHIPGYTHSNSTITNLVNDLKSEATITTQPYNNSALDNGVYQYTSSREFNFTYDAISRGGEQQYIILVDGDLTIGGNIKFPTNGKEGIMFVVTGNIYIKPNVTDLHGLFVSQGRFYTGCNGGLCTTTDPSSLENNLTVQGAVISAGGISLNRLGTSGNQKAETFIYRPDLILFASATAGYADYLWQEIEP